MPACLRVSPCLVLAGRVCCTRDAAASHWSAARGHRDTATLPIGREPGDTRPLVERVVTHPIGRDQAGVVTPRQLEGGGGQMGTAGVFTLCIFECITVYPGPACSGQGGELSSGIRYTAAQASQPLSGSRQLYLHSSLTEPGFCHPFLLCSSAGSALLCCRTSTAVTSQQWPPLKLNQ